MYMNTCRLSFIRTPVVIVLICFLGINVKNGLQVASCPRRSLYQFNVPNQNSVFETLETMFNIPPEMINTGLEHMHNFNRVFV